jgi:hypothetical protein
LVIVLLQPPPPTILSQHRSTSHKILDELSRAYHPRSRKIDGMGEIVRALPLISMFSILKSVIGMHEDYEDRSVELLNKVGSLNCHLERIGID